MKIGTFAKKNKTTIDTIRHYMDLGLLSPRKNKGQYFFSHGNQKDLHEIIHLKSLNFTLSEIKMIFWEKRVGSFSNNEGTPIYRKHYLHKFQGIREEISNLKDIERKLQLEIERCTPQAPSKSIGIPLDALHLLKCPHCSSKLKLHCGSIEGEEIIQGTLRCRCEKEYFIEDGILVIDQWLSTEESYLNDGFLSDYIKDTNDDAIDTIYRSLDWLLNSLPTDSLKGKVILDPGSGVGFSLRSICHLLDDESIYIAVDSDMEKHKFLKKLLEDGGIEKNILFICSDFKRIPLKKESVDVVMDSFNSSCYAFSNTTFLLEEIDSLIKKEALLLGCYLIFKNFMYNSLITPPFRNLLLLKGVTPKLDDLGYKLIDDKSLDPVTFSGPYEDFTVDGEYVFSHITHRRRWG